MEDTFTVNTFEDITIYAVFDGHGGAGAAEYAEAKIIEVLEGTKEWVDYVKDPHREPQALGDALISAFLELDSDLKAYQRQLDGSDTSGCTAVTCMITPQYYLCANIGDSRCVLGTGMDACPMSVDHKPTDLEEEKRVKNAGGKVLW